MGNRIFVAVVVLMWVSTMSWLGARILLPMFGDEPPQRGHQDHTPVAWRVEVNGRHVGFAVSQSTPGAQGTTELHSRVRIEEIPLDQIAPQWMAAFVRDVGPVSIDMRTRTTLDSFAKLNRFDTRLKVNDMQSLIRMTGRVIDNQLEVLLSSGEVSRRLAYPLPEQGAIVGDLTPESKLMTAYVGRRWQEEVHSPFATPQNPVDCLEVEVVEETKIHHDNQLVRVRRVEYRCLNSTGLSAANRLRAVMWVAEDGQVLRQETQLASAKLRFDRMSGEASRRFAQAHLELEKYATLDVSP